MGQFVGEAFKIGCQNAVDLNCPFISVASSGEANDAFLVPNFFLTDLLTSIRVVARTTHIAYIRGSPLPTTMMAFADSSGL